MPFAALEEGDRRLLVAWGSTHDLDCHGEHRFARATDAWSSFASEHAAARPIALGGFAFDRAGALGSVWFRVPTLCYERGGGEARLIALAWEGGPRSAEELVADAAARLKAPGSVPRAGRPLAVTTIHDDGPRYEASVLAALGRIEAGELAKVVLARRDEVEASEVIDPIATFEALPRAGAALAYLFARGEVAFVGATPELLARSDGERLHTLAVAGTRPHPASDAWGDKERREHELVTAFLVDALAPLADVLRGATEERRAAHLAHLVTPVSSRAPSWLLCAAERLHPTPALGGSPRGAALEAVRELEPFERGWFGGGVGWLDGRGGALFVALRCALLEGQRAVLQAGAGIVKGSVPSAERAETATKLAVALHALRGSA
jgi:salicylate biosynthesis isochorismate synthase